MATGRVPTTANSPLTAKGDLFTYSTAPARLAVGNDGETIVADSSTSTGLRYQQTQAKNACYNSAFDVWQRGTSFATTAAANQYSADRWQIYSGTGQKTFSRQSAGSLGTTPAQVAQYCMRVARDSGSTTTEAVYLIHSLETADSLPYMGKTVTLSFYARKGANYSAASSLLDAAIVTGTGTDQNQLSFTGYAVAGNNQSTLTTSWQRFSVTTTLSTTPTELGWRFWYAPTGTAGAADYFEITGVQFEVGSVPTTFNRMSGTIQGELAACQRYYQRFNDAGASATSYANGQASSTTAAYFILNLLTTMRVKPTTLDVNLIRATDYNTGFTPSGSFSIYSGGTSPEKVALGATTFTGLTQFRAYVLESAGSTAAFIGIGAEL